MHRASPTTIASAHRHLTTGIADANGLTGATFSYRWQADDADMAGATGATYTLTDSDGGKAVTVQVSFTDDAGNEEELTSAPTDAVGPETKEAKAANNPATGLSTVSGMAQVGETLTADTSGIADEDGLDSVTFAYQWQADGAAIQDATDATYTPVVDDMGKAMSVTVTFSDDAGNEEELASAATDAVEPETQEAQAANNPATGLPTITGIAQVGVKLTADLSGIADEDGVTNAVLAYQWQADGADIPGETLNCYTPDDADEGKTISVRVSFTDDAGNDESLTSAATAAVEARPNRPATGTLTITGTARVGELLTADVSSIKDDGLDKTAFAYQWQADSTDLSGATGSSYTLAADEVGKTIKVGVSFTDDRGHDEVLTSAAPDAVAGLPSLPLTASLEIAATSHDGESVFTFELRFSEDLKSGYQLQDPAGPRLHGDRRRQSTRRRKRLEQAPATSGWTIHGPARTATAT